jgi:hypothetical protein
MLTQTRVAARKKLLLPTPSFIPSFFSLCLFFSCSICPCEEKKKELNRTCIYFFCFPFVKSYFLEVITVYYAVYIQSQGNFFLVTYITLFLFILLNLYFFFSIQEHISGQLILKKTSRYFQVFENLFKF